VSTAAETTRSLRKDWWIRAVAVLAHPRTTFAALRDDSDESAEARQEPILAIVFLAGIAGMLSTALAGQLLDDAQFDDLNVVIWAFIGGGIYGALVYFVGGLFVYALGHGIGARCSFRQARHVVGLASVPLVVSLVLVWPVRLAIYGDDVFRSGGSDTGVGDKLFEALVVASFLWSLALVAVGLIELRKASSSSASIP
jgi:Yip1-like protein